MVVITFQKPSENIGSCQLPNLYTIVLRRFIVADRINEYRGTGGVRIEDDVIVHANHTELMSVVPRFVIRVKGKPVWLGKNRFGPVKTGLAW